MLLRKKLALVVKHLNLNRLDKIIINLRFAIGNKHLSDLVLEGCR